MLYPISTPLMAALGLSAILGVSAVVNPTCGDIRLSYQDSECCGDDKENETASCFVSAGTAFDDITTSLATLADDVKSFRYFTEDATTRCSMALNAPERVSKNLTRLMESSHFGSTPEAAAILKAFVPLYGINDLSSVFRHIDIGRRNSEVCPSVFDGNNMRCKKVLEVEANAGVSASMLVPLVGSCGSVRAVNSDAMALMYGAASYGATDCTNFTECRLTPVSFFYNEAARGNHWDYGMLTPVHVPEMKPSLYGDGIYGLDSNGEQNKFDLIAVNLVFARLLFNTHTADELRALYLSLWNHVEAGGTMILGDWWQWLDVDTPGLSDMDQSLMNGTLAIRAGDTKPSVVGPDGTRLYELPGVMLNAPKLGNQYRPFVNTVSDAQLIPGFTDSSGENKKRLIRENYQPVEKYENFVGFSNPTTDAMYASGQFVPHLGKSQPDAMRYYFDPVFADHCTFIPFQTINENPLIYSNDASVSYPSDVRSGIFKRSVYYFKCVKPA